jgi:hypothetical protein
MAKIKAHTIVVVLALKQTSIPALVERATAIATAMGENKATFPSPTPPLATVLSDIAALNTAQSALKNHTGSSTDRDAKRVVVVADMGQLHGYVQQLVNANPTEAAVIAGQASMTLKKSPSHTKAPLAVKQTVSGTVVVSAKATAGAKSNEWQYSTDGGKTWIDVPPTTKSKTTIQNLTPGTTVSYRQRPLTKDGLGNWSQPISAVVS